MSYTLEGKIEIPLEDFWQWFHENYVPSGLRSSESVFGVPRVNISNMTIEVEVALDSDNNPRNWIEPPSIIKEWDEKPDNKKADLDITNLGVDELKSLAEHSNTPPETLTLLAHDKVWQVRYWVANSPNTSLETLRKLANDVDKSVRRAAVENPNFIRGDS